ncbi:MAG TPA: phage head closure protein [Alphaproteobacteria bacterium]|nr:phage head closure protein [Alphaproteobacteria bacterium]
MRIGELRKQVIIQQEAQTPDGAGGYSLSWTNVATVWAEITPASGREVYTAQHLEGHVTHHIYMRYRSDIAVTTDMRVLYGARSFNIRSVMNYDERNQRLELLVEEGVAV